MRIHALAAAAALAFAGAAPDAHAQARPGAPYKACGLAHLTPPADTTFTRARAYAKPVSYGRVDGYVTTNDPHPNQAHLMVAMPDTWNGRHVMVATGDAAGFVANPGKLDVNDAKNWRCEGPAASGRM